MNIQFYDSFAGPLSIAEDGGKIVGVELNTAPSGAFERKKTPLLSEALKQFDAYFKGKLKKFDLPLEPRGTDFMLDVWHAVLKIRYGEVATYKDIAARVGRPLASRAVGMSNSRNPIAIIIPCHRVIGSDGSLVGYGYGLGIKRKLLELERKNS
ncbi:MAG: methylated-DNA--[protein]-cysteine S-methyltransferase [Rickettsiales bacterium]|jgi:methylated-DNA-[protein]-cysteine S-methyltransferase|nr:methylated-DNA--[protein]-cysteine S-methyltransferase [Rickettsiales bacterium]